MSFLRVVPVNAFDSATATVSPAAVTTLPIENLQSNVRDDLWRSPNLQPQVIDFNWSGNVRRISHFSLWPSAQASSLIGATVRLQLWQDVALATSLLDQTWDFFTFTGAAWGVDPWGVFRWGVDDDDRTARLAPLSKWFAAVNASAGRVTVANAGAVDTPYFEARRLWLGDYIDAPYNAEHGAAPQWKSGTEITRNRYGPARRNPGGRWREMRLSTVFSDEADRAKWSDIVYECDPKNEIIVSLFSGDASEKKERDFTVMGSLEALNPMVFENTDFHRLELAIVES